MTLATSFFQDHEFIQALYLVAVITFILGLRGLAGPKTAPTGNKIAAVGMLIAIAATLLIPGVLPDGGDRGADHRRHRPRHGDRHPGGAPGEDDRDAADGGAVQRRRRRGGGADRVGRVPAALPGLGRRAVGPEGADPVAVRGDHRLDLVLGLEHRVREAAGDPPGPPDPAARPADRERRARPRGDGVRGDPGERDALRAAVRARHPRVRGGARQPRGAADRRRRHARRDLAAERLHRPVARQRPASRSTTRR